MLVPARMVSPSSPSKSLASILGVQSATAWTILRGQEKEAVRSTEHVGHVEGCSHGLDVERSVSVGALWRHHRCCARENAEWRRIEIGFRCAGRYQVNIPAGLCPLAWVCHGLVLPRAMAANSDPWRDAAHFRREKQASGQGGGEAFGV